MGFFDDEERLEALKRLWADGLSAGQIAQRLNTTRNTVLGKLYRMGLARKGEAKRVPKRAGRARKKAEKPAVPKPRRVSFKPFAHLPQWPEEIAPQRFEEIDVPLAERKTLQELPPDNCRWPIGDPLEAGFHFCNRRQVPGLPYCETHAQRAYQPPVPRGKSSEHENGASQPKELIGSE